MTRPSGLPEGELRSLLVDDLELMTAEDFEAARTLAVRFRLPLERAVAERGRIPVPFLMKQLADRWDVRYTSLKVTDIHRTALEHIGEDYARMHRLMPFELDGGKLFVAMVDPLDRKLVEGLGSVSGPEIVPCLASLESIQRAQLLYRGDLLERLKDAADRTDAADERDPRAEVESAADLFERILEYAVVQGASDIHVEPYEHETLVRLRIDGVLHEVLTRPPDVLRPLASRIKALADLRLDDRRRPQDGRLSGELGEMSVDLRVSTLPTYWGEKVVMRVLPKEHQTIDLEELGLQEGAYEKVMRNISKPFGMILVTGPTGCGKSTSL